ncbi:MAG: flagellar basal-body MS-ring/collar protein FliF [Fidelibacterota bacterium]
MNTFMQRFNLVISQYTVAQRVVITIVIIGMISAITSLLLWANRPEFAVLYSDLDPANASDIIGDLESGKIEYKIERGGRTILVPADKVAELKVQFADLGYLSTSATGYEVFDNSKIGMTTFMQQLNMRRALEGELTKTINQFPGIKNSRVHLVFPEKGIFEDRKNGSASIVLYTAQNTYINQDQVKGIVALVANSVEGIEPDNVVVVDEEGNLLSNAQTELASGTTGSQWELRNAIERKLQSKVRGIVEGVAGYGNVVVEVSVELDFEQVNRTSEFYDPENVVIVSEERLSESSNSGNDSAGTNQEDYSKENVITNYELNKTVEHYTGNSGTIKNISVAVLLNGLLVPGTDEDGNPTTVYQEWKKKDLDRIASLVRSAVGYNPDRGDVVEVQNLKFDRSIFADDQEYFASMEKNQLWSSVIDKSFIGVALILALFLIKSLLKNGMPIFQLSDGEGLSALPEGDQPEALPGGQADSAEKKNDLLLEKLSPEAREKLKKKDQVTEDVLAFSKEVPEDAARIIRTWLMDNRPATPNGR